jgi:hypothetical protein
MSRIFHAARPGRLALLTAVVLAGVLAPATVSTGAGSTASNSEIEGVWSFEHGAVDVTAVAGTDEFEGIVSEKTQFAACPHEVEERMWTKITPQSEAGYYWGLHQWFHADCTKSGLGPTAWRVIEEPKGKRLRVCFSSPGGPQPTISAKGAPFEPSEDAKYHVTYGCVNSNLIEPLPGSQGNNGSGSNGSGSNGTTGSTGTGSTAKGEVEAITLRKTNQCVRPKLFKVSFKEPKHDPFKKLTILFQGHKVRFSRRGRNIVATLNLKRLKQNKFTVKIEATTLLGHRLTKTSTYHLCAPKKPKHHGKKHHKKKG